MVGIVIVSHSENLAESVIELTRMMASEALIVPAGGLPDGGFGTSFDKITMAIESVWSEDGVLILMDMGSAVMTTEMVLEMLNRENVAMVDCPLVEGAVVATIAAVGGRTFDEIKKELATVATTKKF